MSNAEQQLFANFATQESSGVTLLHLNFVLDLVVIESQMDCMDL